MSTTTTCGRFSFCPAAGCIGRGTEGVVYAGNAVASGAAVALKVLSPRTALAPAPVEFSVLHMLPPHASIVPAPCLTSCSVSGRDVLAYPLFPSDLHSVVEAEGCMDEAAVKSIMRQLLTALAHMHKHGFSHNDVKLENMFVVAPAPPPTPTTASPGLPEDASALRRSTSVSSSASSASFCSPPLQVVLGDFGIARKALTLTGRGLGTDIFMAPEVYAIRRANPSRTPYSASAADVWSAAVVGLMCLTLHGVGFDGVCGSTDVTLPECEELQALSREGRQFFTALLAFEPSKRPSAAQALHHPWLQVE